MGLFGGKKKVEEPKVVEEIITEVCDCCGKELDQFATEINPEKGLDDEIAVAGMISRADIPIQCEMYKFQYGDKKICGYCFSQVLNDITGEVYGPQDFLLLEGFKINHINKMLSEMTLDELKNRKQKFDDKMAEYEADKAEAEAKAEEEWLNSLK